VRKAALVVGAIVLSVALDACAAPDILNPAGSQPAPVSVETVTFSADGRQVNVDFIGGRPFEPNDPCSVAYRGTARIVGDQLEIGVYPEPNPATLPPAVACTAEGHPRHLTLSLDQPFTGNLVHDLAGQMLFLGPPDGLAQITGLPAGWELRRQDSIGGSLTPRWERIWSPQADPWPANHSSMVTLIQAFGGAVNATGGLPGTPMKVNGQPATLFLWEPSGDMTVEWSLGEDGVALDGYLADFSPEQFIALAESVSLPSQ